MTTIAMAAGMLPSAMGMGDGGGFRSPMAIAVIGGLRRLDPAVAGLRAGGVHRHRRHRARLWRLFKWLLAPREAREVRENEREPGVVPAAAE